MVRRLSDGDHRGLLAAIGALARVATPSEFGAVAVEGVSGLVRSDVTTFNEVDAAAGRLAYVATPASFAFPAGLDRTLAGLAAQHPLIRHHAESRDGSAIKISDFVDTTAWHRSEVYRQVYAKIGIEHQMSITMPTPAPLVVGVAVNRAECDFDERDRLLLNLVRPHLAHAWRNTRERARLSELLASAADAMQGTGVIAVGVDDAEEVTPRALVSLYRFFGRPAVQDTLPGRVRRWLQTQQALARSGEPPRPPLRAARGPHQLSLRYLPGLAGRRDVLLLDETATDRDPRTLLAAGLTDREIDVLEAIGRGATNAETAATLHLSPWTVKRHLANVYAKLGARGRVEAVAAARELDLHHRTPRR